jgi:hypothetical protein
MLGGIIRNKVVLRKPFSPRQLIDLIDSSFFAEISGSNMKRSEWTYGRLLDVAVGSEGKLIAVLKRPGR